MTATFHVSYGLHWPVTTSFIQKMHKTFICRTLCASARHWRLHGDALEPAHSPTSTQKAIGYRLQRSLHYTRVAKDENSPSEPPRAPGASQDERLPEIEDLETMDVHGTLALTIGYTVMTRCGTWICRSGKMHASETGYQEGMRQRHNLHPATRTP